MLDPQNSQENTCAEVSFLIKVNTLRPATLLKRDSGTNVFLRIRTSFFYRTSLVAASVFRMLSYIYDGLLFAKKVSSL